MFVLQQELYEPQRGLLRYVLEQPYSRDMVRNMLSLNKQVSEQCEIPRPVYLSLISIGWHDSQDNTMVQVCGRKLTLHNVHSVGEAEMSSARRRTGQLSGHCDGEVWDRGGQRRWWWQQPTPLATSLQSAHLLRPLPVRQLPLYGHVHVWKGIRVK